MQKRWNLFLAQLIEGGGFLFWATETATVSYSLIFSMPAQQVYSKLNAIGLDNVKREELRTAKLAYTASNPIRQAACLVI